MSSIDVTPAGRAKAPERSRGSQWIRLWIPLCAALFIAALAGSAIVVPQLHWAYTLMVFIAIPLPHRG